jgi:hypothetical protein
MQFKRPLLPVATRRSLPPEGRLDEAHQGDAARKVAKRAPLRLAPNVVAENVIVFAELLVQAYATAVIEELDAVGQLVH